MVSDPKKVALDKINFTVVIEVNPELLKSA